MSSWGPDIFENDHALDWIGALREGKKRFGVEAVLERILHDKKVRHVPTSFIGRWLLRMPRGDNFIMTGPAHDALAAAEVVAFWHGYPSESFPGHYIDLVQSLRGQFHPALVPLAKNAVAVIKTESSLVELITEAVQPNGPNASRTWSGG